MCKVSSIILQSDGCLLLLNGGLAHKWTKWTYQLCGVSQDGRLCGNEENLNALGDNYGYRSGSCLVCDNEYRARSNYETALAAAQTQYNLVVNAAWSKKLEEEQEACYTIDTVILTARHSLSCTDQVSMLDSIHRKKEATSLPPLPLWPPLLERATLMSLLVYSMGWIDSTYSVQYRLQLNLQTQLWQFFLNER